MMYYHWILRTKIKKISFEEIFKEEGNFETEEEIMKKSIEFLEKNLKNSSFKPETFPLKDENEIEIDLGKFFFFEENFEKAKEYLSQGNTKESKNMFFACESVLSKKKSKIEEIKTKILDNAVSISKNLPGLSVNRENIQLDATLLSQLFDLLIRDNFEQNFSIQERVNLAQDFSFNLGVKIQILACNLVKCVFSNHQDEFFMPYLYDENFIKNFILFSQRTFELKSEEEFKKKLKKKIYNLCGILNSTHLWKFLIDQSKDFVDKDQIRNSFRENVRRKFMILKTKKDLKEDEFFLNYFNLKRKINEISLDENSRENLNPQKFKIQDVSYFMKKSLDFLIQKNYNDSTKYLNLVIDSPIKSKKISTDLKYLTILIQLSQNIQTKENLNQLTKLSNEKEFCEIEILVNQIEFNQKMEIFRILINLNENNFLATYFERIQQERISFKVDSFCSFVIDYLNLKETETEGWYKFLSKLCKKEKEIINEELFSCLISVENYSQLIKFSSFLGFSLFSHGIYMKESNEEYKNFRSLASFTFNENYLIAPSPNLR
jgi:hypothetical protein